MLLSVLYVRFRDVAIIWVVVAQVLFYATPILYPIDTPSRTTSYEHLLMINPLALIFEQVRVWMHRTATRPDRVRSGRRLASTCCRRSAIFVGVCVFGVWIFNREAPRIAEDL